MNVPAEGPKDSKTKHSSYFHKPEKSVFVIKLCFHVLE